MKTIVTAAAVLALATLGAGAAPARADDDVEEAEELIGSADEKCDALEKLAAEELEDSIVKGTRIESSINGAIGKLEAAIDELKEKFDSDEKLKKTREEAKAVRSAAQEVEAALGDITRESEIWEKWKSLEDEIDKLAEVYGLARD
jgi:DNA repair exonuclease SbcCD ATPase subunit